MKILRIALMTLVFSLAVGFTVNAGNLGVPRIPNPTNFGSLEDIINFGVGLLRPIFIITFLGVVLYGAFLWLTSQGDDEKIKKARNTIVAAIVGISIAVFAPAIMNLVASFLGVSGLTL